jgi:hypothetical protein
MAKLTMTMNEPHGISELFFVLHDNFDSVDFKGSFDMRLGKAEIQGERQALEILQEELFGSISASKIED